MVQLDYKKCKQKYAGLKTLGKRCAQPVGTPPIWPLTTGVEIAIDRRTVVDRRGHPQLNNLACQIVEIEFLLFAVIQALLSLLHAIEIR